MSHFSTGNVNINFCENGVYERRIIYILRTTIKLICNHKKSQQCLNETSHCETVNSSLSDFDVNQRPLLSDDRAS